MTRRSIHPSDVVAHLEKMGYFVDHNASGEYEVFSSSEARSNYDLCMTFTPEDDGLVDWLEYWHDVAGWSDLRIGVAMQWENKSQVVAALM